MNLDDLCDVFFTNQFPKIDKKEHPHRSAVIAARTAAASAVVDPDFLLDCISHELQRLKSDNLRLGLAPFFTIPTLGIALAFGYWAPGETAHPHEHTAWTITAVCRNYLQVKTYDRQAAYQQQKLIQKNCFDAPVGRVGFIYEPCIHEPINTTEDWSISLHITSPRDGERRSMDETPPQMLEWRSNPVSANLRHPYVQAIIARRRQQYLLQVALLLAQIKALKSADVLERCLEISSSRVRRIILNHAQIAQPASYRTPWCLARVHPNLEMDCRIEGEQSSLYVDTPNGWSEQLAVNKMAHEAIAFVASHQTFDVCELPGDFSDAERDAFAEALEDTGLFVKVRQ